MTSFLIFKTNGGSARVYDATREIRIQGTHSTSRVPELRTCVVFMQDWLANLANQRDVERQDLLEAPSISWISDLHASPLGIIKRFATDLIYAFASGVLEMKASQVCYAQG